MTETKRQLGLDRPLILASCLIDALKPEDQGDLLAFFRDRDLLARYLPAPLRDFTPQSLAELLADWNNGKTDFLLAIREKGRLIGLLNVDNVDLENKNAEIGIALTDPAARGRGLATEALEGVVSHLLCGRYLHRLYARIIVGNQRSLALFERLGFEREGELRGVVRRDGGYLDMVLVSRLGI